ncbi:MAG: hypothetical protein LBL56_03070 [Treponema sp.]|jgi:hypothetical protein|nr:hypothetical protein [Treponema sp.]
MVTNWIQAICSICTVLITGIGVFRALPKISKDINKSSDERLDKLEQQLREYVRGYSDQAALDMWKRLINLYTNNPAMHEYSNLNENKK